MAQIPVPHELIHFIKTSNKFIVIGHKEPDGDCVGSQLALCSALRRLGKEATACSAGPFDRPEIRPYAPLFTSSIDEKEKNGSAAIIVDCSAVSRTGGLEPLIEGLPVAIIDHHATTEHSLSTQQAPVFLDPASPSCTILVAAIIEELGLEIIKEEADLLFFGLCTDTGFFRHLNEKGGVAFEAAAKLISAGANPKNTFLAISGGKSFNSRVLLGHILSRAQTFFDGKLILSYETLEETKLYGQEGRDSDSLYQLLQSVAGVEVIVIIRQESADNCTVGFRSGEKIDVAAIAASFGGGGHKNAAGLSIKGTISSLMPNIIEAFAKVFH